MAYEMKTIEDIRRRLKQAPDDLKLVVFDSHTGNYWPIERIENQYAIPTTEEGYECYQPADEDEEGAIQVMVIT